MNEQERIQVWNDAVEACRNAAWEEVHRMEIETANGMPNQARVVVRAVGGLIRPGDERRKVHGLSSEDFPALPARRSTSEEAEG